VLSAANRRSASTAAIQQLGSGYSIEVTPAAASKIKSFEALPGLRAGTVVNVTFLPGSDVNETISICDRLSSANMKPVAHLPARSFASLADVDSYLASLTAVGVREVLVLAGGASSPAGELTEALQILRSGLLQEHGIERIGVAAHPEGHPDVPNDVLMQALLDKAQWAQQNDADLYFATQFCFEPDPIIAWEDTVRKALKERLGSGSSLPPVHIGVAGPAKIASLIKFGTMSGVGASLRFVSKYAGNVFKLATTSAPDSLLVGLSERREEESEFLVNKLHYYPFGGMKPTLRWANAVEEGRLEVDDSGGFNLIE